ncbi:auxin-responsive protein SAUR32-like [Dioscorea cayenensis subsp. rotundata]|uniref:Auxin-responsive protein SAUR32-like n=1 Tax=Dioscorea cayennensis subsp. rotundata TaxID=55577 RepID=A0AB40CQD6_DIOCR|nr:auxin-responsive protein SAUR32-like [Dioscorea cayenensis subsp. rotundata]
MAILNHHHHHHLMGFHMMISNTKKSSSSSTTSSSPPKGCMVVRVGSSGEEKERFIVKVEYLNHPLFAGLLKEAEDEYGFEHKGAITIPCCLDEFLHVIHIIDREFMANHHHHHHHHQYHHLHLAGCFRP